MAPSPTHKRKSRAQPDGRDNVVVSGDSDASDQPNKRAKKATPKTNLSHFARSAQSQLDSDGNQYWEISRMRRVTISDFKGKRMVNIREYYEKDGKDLPGKKGISMTVEQYSAFVDVLPQIGSALAKMGEKVPRPKYDGTIEEASTETQNEEAHKGNETEAEVEAEANDTKTRAKNGKKKKANIEATSDEDGGEDS